MAMTRGQFATYFTRGLKEVFWTHYREAESVYERIYNVARSEKNYEEVLGLVGFGYLPKEGELETVTLQDALEGFKTRFTHVKYGLGYQISQELIDDDMYGQIREFPAALARSARATMEKISADVFNNGFSTSFTGADGKPLFATDHPLKRGGTGSNRAATAADLSFSALRQGAIDLRKITDDAGIPIGGSTEITLLVPPDVEFDAAEIIKSVERPDTANRAVNALRQQRRWDLIVWDYLTDTDAWFLLYPKNLHKLICFIRKDIDQEADRDIKTDAFWHVVRFRKSVGWADWRGTYGNPGA
ncbi:MAG: Mu-like prophage major head subunit gpT family protein [Armatimonadota bacterium]|nr:Mu-like prophage major head subunit gpT family protein [Armatimonadota bacterium]